MKNLAIVSLIALSLSGLAQKAKTKTSTAPAAKAPEAKVEVSTPAKAEDPSMPRVRELAAVFFKFIDVIHGPDVSKARVYLADGVLTAVNDDNLKALAKSIRTDLKMIILSTAMEVDNGRSGWELVQFKYENGPEPTEIFQIVFDKTNKIAFINSNHPNKKDMVTKPD